MGSNEGKVKPKVQPKQSTADRETVMHIKYNTMRCILPKFLTV